MNQLTKHAYYYFKRKLAVLETSSSAVPLFVEVPVEPAMGIGFLCSAYFYPHLLTSSCKCNRFYQKDEDNYFHLKPQRRASSSSSSSNNASSAGIPSAVAPIAVFNISIGGVA